MAKKIFFIYIAIIIYSNLIKLFQIFIISIKIKKTIHFIFKQLNYKAFDTLIYTINYYYSKKLF